MAAFVAGI